MATKWWDYIERGLREKGLTQSALADAVGVNRSSASGWKNGAAPKPATVVAVAEALGTPISEALIAAGLMTEEELGVNRTIPDIELLSDDQLIAELNRRLKKATTPESKAKPAQRTRRTGLAPRKASSR
ncbi:helix-turn-helix domain-containing protein [Rhodococcus hoagii]|nr:helix-turn-helix domain-containing protein [Prescottella equi]